MGTPDAAASGSFRIGGDRSVNRMGFGAMRLTGDGIWGPPDDPDEAIRILKRAVDLGVNFIDTADSYGPFVSEELIAEALAPYDEDLVIATKGGLTRDGPGGWHAVGRPEYLRQCVEMSLRRLRLEQIPLYQLHRIDPQVPAADQFGVLKELQDEGKIRHIGLSEAGVDEIQQAQETIRVATVQNQYSLNERRHEDVLDYCEAQEIGFIPWNPLHAGNLANKGGPVDEAAERTGATPAQVALSWLLRRSEVMLPIPGTSNMEHLEENIAAAERELPDDLYEQLTEATAAGA
ncbi:MAG: oxidoreductase [Bacteroidetes bacterium QS_7_67_15]|jgi:aryl-alcohol dehydrogenase-like predicted oxidoreductase|nr:MAG: oxidoreductase [Bacteroidetes bacterium QS_7_67_15]